MSVIAEQKIAHVDAATQCHLGVEEVPAESDAQTVFLLCVCFLCVFNKNVCCEHKAAVMCVSCISFGGINSPQKLYSSGGVDTLTFYKYYKTSKYIQYNKLQ